MPERTSEFHSGAAGNYQTGIAPTSVLLPYMKSHVATNTSSSTDQNRATIGGQLLPSSNGYATNTYNSIFTGTPTRVGF